MPPSTEDEAEGPRFDRVERWFHWANAVLFLVLLATAAALYLDPLSRLVGRRALMRDVHVYSGLLLPVLWVLALGPLRTAALRADVARLNRWTAQDWRWARSLGRDPYAEPGKFNAGQKLNAAIIAGAVPVMVGTGAVMRWFTPFPLAWRTGATFVHDWLAVVVFAFTVGHIVKALSHPKALRAMWSGSAKPVSPPVRSR